jgi:hypothetical protein
LPRIWERLERFFAEYPALSERAMPDGGCIGFPRYKDADGVEQLAGRLVEETGVLLLPASIYRSELTPVPGSIPENQAVTPSRMAPAAPPPHVGASDISARIVS